MAASVAYGCGALARLSVHPGSADAGATVNGVGQGFSNAHGGAPSAEPVVVRFNSRSGQVLWSGRPDASGNIDFSFTVPNVSPGSYTIIATQTNADGQPAPGTPARASFTVTGTPAPAPSQQAAPAEQPSTAQPAPAAAPAPAPTASASPAPAPAPSRTASPARATSPARSTATAVRPRATASPAPAPAPAPAEAPAPTQVTPAPAVETPAPALVPAPEAAPRPAPAMRSTMVSMAGNESDGAPWLAIGLVGAGLVLSLAASAMVLGARREERAPARVRR